MEHAPDTWIVVIGEPGHVTVSAMCRCGDDNCGWTATAYRPAFVNARSDGTFV